VNARRGRTAARWIGDILITLGVVVGLLLVYQLWWTNGQAARAAESGREELAAAWNTNAGVVQRSATASPSIGGDASAPPSPSASAETDPQPVAVPRVGKPFALMYIPRLRDKVWGLPVVEGVGLDELAMGVGHYPGTAMPGEIGNFATAAHRATHGEPFRDIDRIKKGDRVIVETRNGWYVYELDTDQIVKPTDTWVIDPVPGEPDAEPTEALITLTTCNPRWASYERWIWWGYLVEQRTRADGPPAELADVKGG
jgi:sortase A